MQSRICVCVCVCVCLAPRPSSDTCSFKLLCRNVSILCTPVFSVHVSYIFNLKTSMHCLPLPELPWRKQGVRFLRKIKKEIMYLCIFQSWAHMSLACCCVLLLIKRCDFLSACLTVLWMSVYSILSVTQHTHTHTHTHEDAAWVGAIFVPVSTLFDVRMEAVDQFKRGY